jgi:hypothetical protein
MAKAELQILHLNLDREYCADRGEQIQSSIEARRRRLERMTLSHSQQIRSERS